MALADNVVITKLRRWCQKSFLTSDKHFRLGTMQVSYNSIVCNSVEHWFSVTIWRKPYVEAYGEHALGKSQCFEWFEKFRSGNFDARNEERGRPPKKFRDSELRASLDAFLYFLYKNSRFRFTYLVNRRRRWLRSRCVDDIVRPGRSHRSIASHFFVPSSLESTSISQIQWILSMDLLWLCSLPRFPSIHRAIFSLIVRKMDYEIAGRKRTKRNELGEFHLVFARLDLFPTTFPSKYFRQSDDTLARFAWVFKTVRLSRLPFSTSRYSSSFVRDVLAFKIIVTALKPPK